MLIQEYIVLIAGVAVDIGFAIVSVILYNRLRKNGVPEKSGKKKIIITAKSLLFLLTLDRAQNWTDWKKRQSRLVLPSSSFWI